MKKVFSDYIYDILGFDGGFMVVYRRGERDGKVVVSYKSVMMETGVVSQRTKDDYEFIKFGDIHSSFEFKGADFITCNCVKMDNDNLFIVTQSGDAAIIDNDGNTQWQGIIRYKDCGPAAVVRLGHTLWASFPERNALVRFNLRTMREELRIGGSNDSSFAGPKGLWIDEHRGTLLVCNSKGNNILEVNVKTYTVQEKAVFDEPVHQYMQVEGKEFVLLDSGLYLL